MNRVIERPVVSGWLEKKSGGKEGGPKKKWNDKWDKRWFALVGSQLAYYRSEDDYTKGKAPLGFVECAGAKLFLKEVKGTVFRFTILSEARELKLRAPTPTVYKLWADAITPLARTVSLLEGEEDGDDEVEDGDVPISGRGAAASVVNECTISGWLEKKSGGKEGSKKAALFEKWDKRWFALLGTQLVYHKSEKDQLAGNPPLGSIECFGAQCFLKEVKGTVFRFTIRSDTRELKLRASNAQEYQGWTRALGPLTNQRRMEESDRFGDPFSSRRDDDDDDDDDYLRDRASTDSWLDGTSGEHDNDDGVPRERSKTEQVHMPTRNTAALDRARAAQSHGNMFAASAPTPVASAAPPPKDFGRLRQASTADHGDLSGSSSDEGAGDGADGTASVEADTPAAVRLERAPSLDVLFTDYDDFSEQDEEETDPEGDEQGAQAAKTQQKHRSSSEVAGTGESARPRGGSFLSRLFGGGSNPFDSDGGANPFGSAAPSANSVPEAVGEHKASAKRPSSNVPSSASSSNPFGSEDPPVRRVSSASIDSSLAYPITEGAGTRPGSSIPSGTSSGGTAPFKIIIVGDSGVGKTSLLVRFLEGRYTGTERPTLAVDVSSASLDLGTSTVGLSLWDTAGQERFAPLSAPYFRKADGVIVVFDVGSRTSFTRVGTHWEEEIFYKADPDVTVLLVGAKADVPNDQRAVSTEEAQSLAEEKGWLYFETSAMTGVHVRDAFYLLACTVMNRLLEADPANILNDGKSMPPTQQRGFLLGQGAPGQKQGGCC